MSDWLEQLKPGDKVIIDGCSKSVCTVGRVTKTQVIVNVENHLGKMYEERFTKSNGFRLGDSTWNRTILREATPKAVAAIETAEIREKARSAIRSANLAKLSIDQLTRIVAIIREGEDAP